MGPPLQGVSGCAGWPTDQGVLLIKRLVLAAAVVTALGSAVGAASAGQACLTSSITVNGTAAPTNGTNCVDTP